MVDFAERTMMFTLNGEVLLDDSGSELAFKDFDVCEGEQSLFSFVIPDVQICKNVVFLK